MYLFAKSLFSKKDFIRLITGGFHIVIKEKNINVKFFTELFDAFPLRRRVKELASGKYLSRISENI